MIKNNYDEFEYCSIFMQKVFYENSQPTQIANV
jgi:hypothetical protein